MRAKKDKFEELKIKMVMRLKRISRAAAVEEIARMDAARKSVPEERNEDCLEIGVDEDTSYSRAMEQDGGELLSAKEFFQA